MGPIGIFLGLGGTAIAGTAWGLKARGDDAMLMDADVQRDLDSLRSTGAIPTGVQPTFSLTPHRQKSMLSRYLLGVGLGGFGAWLLTLIIALVVIEGTGQDGAPVEKVIPSLMVAALVGLGGFVVPVLLIGAWLWIREARARVREATAEGYRAYWGERERGAQALAQGQATPDQVGEVLARFHTNSVADTAATPDALAAPVQGRWHGEVGQPLMIAAEVQAVDEVYGEGGSHSRLRAMIEKSSRSEMDRYLGEVEATIAVEEAEDAQAPDYPRGEIKTFDGFAGTGVTPRGLPECEETVDG